MHYSTHVHCIYPNFCSRLLGSLARVGPNELVTCDPEILRRVWGVRSRYTRGDFYDAVRFDPERDNLISMRSDAAHKALKEKMAPGVRGSMNLLGAN